MQALRREDHRADVLGEITLNPEDQNQKYPPSRTIANGGKAQRCAMQEERLKGIFDGAKLLEASPIGKAIAKGFPLINAGRNHFS